MVPPATPEGTSRVPGWHPCAGGGDFSSIQKSGAMEVWWPPLSFQRMLQKPRGSVLRSLGLLWSEWAITLWSPAMLQGSVHQSLGSSSSKHVSSESDTTNQRLFSSFQIPYLLYWASDLPWVSYCSPLTDFSLGKQEWLTSVSTLYTEINNFKAGRYVPWVLGRTREFGFLSWY